MIKKAITCTIIKKNKQNYFSVFNFKVKSHFKYKKIVNFIHNFQVDNKYKTCKRHDIISIKKLSPQSKIKHYYLFNIIKKYFKLNSFYDSNTNLFENCG